jgi:hypothetical protein
MYGKTPQANARGVGAHRFVCRFGLLSGPVRPENGDSDLQRRGCDLQHPVIDDAVRLPVPGVYVVESETASNVATDSVAIRQD